MPKTVVEKLREGLSAFPLTERRVANRLLADYPIAGLQSASGVSAPTVRRRVARLGFGAYPEFQRQLREELTAQMSSPLAKESAQGTPARGAGGYFDGVAHALIENLQESFANLSIGEIEAVVSLLSYLRLRVHLFGGCFTDALARYLAVQMRILRPSVRPLQHQGANWHGQVLDIGRKDLLVVYDIRRYEPSLYKLADAAVKRGACVLLLTDQWLSPIAKLARHVLPARVTVPSIWDSNVVLMALSEVLLAGVSQHDREYSRARISALERLREA